MKADGASKANIQNKLISLHVFFFSLSGSSFIPHLLGKVSHLCERAN